MNKEKHAYISSPCRAQNVRKSMKICQWYSAREFADQSAGSLPKALDPRSNAARLDSPHKKFAISFDPPVTSERADVLAGKRSIIRR
jgi:hypothetical protein